MTNHIEELMKAAGVKSRFYMQVNVGDLDCNFQEVSEKTLKKLWDNWGFHLDSSSYWMDEEDGEQIPENYEDFKKSDFWEKKYPDFTPAKQLELLKLICKNCCIDIDRGKIKYSIIGSPIIYELDSADFSVNLSALVTQLLGKVVPILDKLEVKRILEDEQEVE